MVIWRNLFLAAIFLTVTGLAGTSAAQDAVEIKKNITKDMVDSDVMEDPDELDEVVVMETDISKLPDIVSAAAQGAKENFAITGFTKEVEVGQLVYDVYGLSQDLCYEIEVTENGQVLDIENCD